MRSLMLVEQLSQVSGYCFTAIQHKICILLCGLFWPFCQVHSAVICAFQLSVQSTTESAVDPT